MSAADPVARARTARTIDLSVAVVLALAGALLVLWIIAQYAAYGSLADACAAFEPVGTICDPGFLGLVTAIGYVVVVAAWLGSAAMLVFRAWRRKAAWYWPILGAAVAYASYWVVVLVLSFRYLPPVGT
ncbi:MAG: hypothetical protein J0G30_11540 [Actinomycetales bacterium]|nr:hypothetical protein [Actinomycetales bacterium]